MAFYYPTTSFSLTGKTLVIPVVSVANVAQLGADLLIASLGLVRVGLCDPQWLVPVIGAREDGDEGITMPLEVYGKDGQTIVVMQQRSPVLKAFKQDFVDALLDFVKSSGASAAIFLGGVDTSNRTDAQMLTPTSYILPRPQHAAPAPASALEERIKDLPIPSYTSLPQFPENAPGVAEQQQQQHLQQAGGDAGGTVPFIPGGGLTRRILSSLSADWPVPTIALLQYVIEGDNRADAHLAAAVAAKVAGVDVDAWKQPASWGEGLFGAPHDQTLYG